MEVYKETGKVTHTVVNDEGEAYHNTETGYSKNYDKNKIINKAIQKVNNNRKLLTQNPELQKFLKQPIDLTKQQLMNRQLCLERFRRSYRKSDAMQ